MARYADVVALVEEIRFDYCRGCKNHNGSSCISCWVRVFLDKIEGAPTADVVPVVRCKNCKHLTEDGICRKNIRGVGGYKKPSPDDFCSSGERKGGAQ